MNIGIVIDGVLTDLERFQFDYGSKFYFGQEMELKNPRGKSVDEIFGRHGNYLEKKINHSFWERYYEFYLSKGPVRLFASEIIQKLHQMGYQIYLLTTRTLNCYALSKEKVMQLTQLWLAEQGIYFDFLIFSDIINVELIKKYEIDLLLDHHPHSIFHIAMQIPVICFHAKYNELCKGENVYRVFSWYDFYGKLDMILELEMLSLP